MRRDGGSEEKDALLLAAPPTVFNDKPQSQEWEVWGEDTGSNYGDEDAFFGLRIDIDT